MILQALADYYEILAEKGLVEIPGWGQAKVSFALEIDIEGRLKRVISIKESKEQGKKIVWNPQLLKVPEQVTRSSGISANFLCDNSSYFFGVDQKGKPERSIECFRAAREKHLGILEECDSEAAKAVKAYFEKWSPEIAEKDEKLREDKEEILAGGNMVFMYQGRYVQEDEEIQKAWEQYYRHASEENMGICMVSGKKDEISRIHNTIKGVPGAQSSGAALVSFNAPSFESYGKEQSFNAPVGAYAMYAYTTALNYLIADRKHRSIIGDTLIVYWAENGGSEYQDIFASMMDPGSEADMQDMISGVFQNLERWKSIDVDAVEKQISMGEKFYILGLSPNAARLSVRFFYQDSFGNILKHLKEHYDRMKIVRPVWDSIEYKGVWRMLQETVNKKSRDKKPIPHMAASTYRAILSGERYPSSLYSAVISRIRAEQDDTDSHIQKITPGRAAIVKAFLIHNYKEEVTVELNENNHNIAYVLGREFAVLEAIQEAANPGINSTIKDRYFNSACATPAVVFPILFRLKNSHIKKISNRGQAINYEKLLGSLQEKIMVSDDQETAYPKRLSLEEQGMFILGYYHQNQKRYEKTNKHSYRE